jgi:hypothetical protein
MIKEIEYRLFMRVSAEQRKLPQATRLSPCQMWEEVDRRMETIYTTLLGLV